MGRDSEIMGKWKLPEGWKWKRLSETGVSQIIMGQSPPGKTYNDKMEGLPFFQGKADFGSLYPTPRKWCTEPKKIAEPGDVLISVRAPVGPTNLCLKTCCIGRGLAAIRPGSQMNSRFLLFALRAIEPEIAQKGQGSTFAAITKRDLVESQIPVPPLGEQRRIVAHVEELFARIEEARWLRFTADEDAEALFSAASAEAFEPLFKEDRPTSEFKDLIIDSRNGLYKPQSFYGEGTLIVRIDSFEAGRIRDFGELKCLQLTQDEFDKYSLQVGDVLVNRVNGSLDELGKAAVVHDLPEPMVFESNIMRFRVYRDKVLPEFVVTFLGSHQGRTQIQARARAIQQFSINQADVGSITVPVPPLPEQRRIVEYLESVQTEVKDLKRTQAKSTAELERLEQSILARAFRGEL
jgi:type I restriction enzyme S subunit